MKEIPSRWKHQIEAFNFIDSLFARKHHGAMAAMVMGSGKSRVAAETATSQKAQRLLILCPLRVIDVWRQQIERFAPQFHFVGLGADMGTGEDRLRIAARYRAWNEKYHHPVALAINYDSARLPPFAGWAAARPWDMVIADESHRLKDPRGRASLWMAKLGLMTHWRLALTGTPMPHMPIDIWAQFRFVNPFHLEKTYAEFKLRYAVMGGYMNKQVKEWRDLDDLERRFRELAFRVDESVLDLPPEMDEIRSTEMSERGARIYRQMEREMIAWIGETSCVTAANAMVKLLRLQQMTSGWIPNEAGELAHIDAEKEILLEELLTDLDEPVVVFCRFRSDLEAVNRVANRAIRHSWELSGERDELADWQKSTGSDVLAVQIQAGGVGVDLTRARVAIYYSIGFSLSDYLQSRARIRRPPQKRHCLFIHLQVRDSIDEYVLRAVEKRGDLVDSVLNELKTKGAKHVVAR